jgi:hypothetical protein
LLLDHTDARPGDEHVGVDLEERVAGEARSADLGDESVAVGGARFPQLVDIEAFGVGDAPGERRDRDDASSSVL